MIIEGTLNVLYENGASKVLWTLCDNDKDMNGLYIIRTGDFLKIYDEDDKLVWHKCVELDTNINAEIFGYIIDATPSNIDIKTWANYFFKNFKAVLIRT